MEEFPDATPVSGAAVFRGLCRFFSNGLMGYPSFLPVSRSPDPCPSVQRLDFSDLFPRVYVQFPGAVIFQHRSPPSAFRAVNELNGNPSPVPPVVFRPDPIPSVFFRSPFSQSDAFPLFQLDGMLIFRPVQSNCFKGSLIFHTRIHVMIFHFEMDATEISGSVPGCFIQIIGDK